MSVDPEVAVSVEAWDPEGLAALSVATTGGLKAVGSQDRMFSRARLRIMHQPKRSSRVSADRRWRIEVEPDLAS